jgi:alkanesulfonate monooxygenase SsuD/methylene tetrahydromethanopterin reductase-like flavin-dependent oxidoreductase (luciferase family)
MRFGAHLPLIDFDGAGYSPTTLRDYVEAASASGFDAISANDHLVYQRPWLDGIVALASVLERTGDLMVATTVSLPVVRGPVALAKAANALQTLSDGRLVLGVGPGSSPRDYEAVGLPFEERWQLFDASITVLRDHLADSVPLWIGSWGSPAGLRRVARRGDGWLASGYNTSPALLAAGREELALFLLERGKDPASFPVSLATMWSYASDDPAAVRDKLEMVATMVGRDPDELSRQVPIGSPGHCVELFRSYAAAGVGTLFLWPVHDPVGQLRLIGERVIPLVGQAGH